MTRTRTVDVAAQNRLIERFELDHEPLLRSIRDNALATLRDLEAAYSDRRFGYSAQTVSDIVETALAIGGYADDFISNVYGNLLLAADDIGLAEDILHFDGDELHMAVDKWRKRSNARSPAALSQMPMQGSA